MQGPSIFFSRKTERGGLTPKVSTETRPPESSKIKSEPNKLNKELRRKSSYFSNPLFLETPVELN